MVNFQGHIWGLVQEFDMVEFFTNPNIFTGEPRRPSTSSTWSPPTTSSSTATSCVQAGIIPWAQGGFSPGGYGSWGTIFGARFYDNDARNWTINRPENLPGSTGT